MFGIGKKKVLMVPLWLNWGPLATIKRLFKSSLIWVAPGATEGIISEGMLIEGMLIEGMLIEGMLIEGMLIEGMLFEGMLIEGMLFEGMLFEGMWPSFKEGHVRFPTQGLPSNLCLIIDVEDKRGTL